MRPSLAERWAEHLPQLAGVPVVTLGEGSTPLLPAPRLSERLGVELWLKWEGANPTGSFKDRGMTVAVSRALADGAPGVVCASTGNTAASAAAYAARAGIEATIVVAEGAAASSKLAQVRAVGARVVEVPGTFSDAYDASVALAEREGFAQVNSTNEHRIAGQMTAAFEIVEELGGAARRADAALRRRRQHEGVRPRLPRARRRAAAAAPGARRNGAPTRSRRRSGSSIRSTGPRSRRRWRAPAAPS